MSSSEPQMLITSCADGVYKLIATESRLKSSTSEVIAGMVRIDAFTRRKDADQWAELDTDFQHVVAESEHTAVKLAAAIKVYISLQQDIGHDDAADMIVELDALKTHVTNYQFDQHSALADLITRAGYLKQQHQQAVEARRASVTRRMQDASREVDACKAQLQELYHQHTAASHTILKETCQSGASSSMPNHRSNSLPLPQPAAGSSRPVENGKLRKTSRSQKSLDTQAEISAQINSSRALEGQIELVQGALADSQDRCAKAQATLQIFERAGWESTRNTTQSVMTYLAKLDKRMGALLELRRQLLHEVGAYQLAFEGMRSYPGPTRRTALMHMQERVASTASAWKAVAALLTDEYAKGRG